MQKYRIVQKFDTELDEWYTLEKKDLFGWVYVKGSTCFFDLIIHYSKVANAKPSTICWKSW